MSFVVYRLSWPRETTKEQVLAALRALAGIGGTPVVLDTLGRRGHVEHRLQVRESHAGEVVRQLRAAIPGIGVERVETPEGMPGFGLAARLELSTRRRPLAAAQPEPTARSLLVALSGVGREEAILLRWELTDRLHPTPAPSSGSELPPESFTRALLRAPFASPGRADSDVRSAIRDKQSLPGWRAAGRVAVMAASDSRRRQLMRSVIGALSTAEGPGVRLGSRTMPVRRVERLGGHGRLRLNISELAAVSGWPIGSTAQLPVVKVGSRRLPASRAIPKEGRVLGEGTWPGGERPLALSVLDGAKHIHALGPSGVGKSTLLCRLVEQDLAAGRGVFLVDPKGDLVNDVLERVPERRRDDVVVLSAVEGEQVVGFNPLAVRPGESVELAADQLFGVFHQLSLDHWGPRLSEVLSAGLLTLARAGGHSLASLPPLLTDVRFRRRIVGRLNDPIGLQPFWAQYEAWSEAERLTAVQPVLRRLRPLLLRPGLRRLVGQPDPGFSFSDIFRHRRVVLVDLARGQIGDSASLVGAMALGLFWRAAQWQSALPASQRPPVSTYLDEFQVYPALGDLEDAFATARSLNVSFCVAHQHLRQLPAGLRAAVLANARSRVAFQLSAEDARELSRDHPQIEPDDFLSLDPYHFYAQLTAGNQVQPWCSGRTYPPSKPVTDAAALRAYSAERYGRAADEIDRDIEAMLGVSVPTTPGDVGPRPRGGRA